MYMLAFCSPICKLNCMSKQFLNQSDIDEVVSELLTHFQFNLTSRSSIHEIADNAQEILIDNDLPSRRSLAIIIAKQAKARFVGQIESTKSK
jgi:hypothetical protein